MAAKQVKIKILIHEQNDADANFLESFLKSKGLNFVIKSSKTSTTFFELLYKMKPSVIIAGYSQDQFDCTSILEYFKKNKIDIPVIIVTQQQSDQIAVQCMKKGAYDYINKSDLTSLPKAISDSIKSSNVDNDKLSSKKQNSINHELYENFLNTLSEINIGFLVIDPATLKFLYVNETYANICGYNVEEIFSLSSLLEIINTENQENFKIEFAKVFKHNNPIHIFNTLLTTKEGKKINAEFTARRFIDNGSSRIIMIVKDMTETVSKNLMKKLIDDALHESEGRYRSLIENVEDYAIFMLDFNGRIISWNAGAEKIMGYQEKEIILKKVFIFFAQGTEEQQTSSINLFEKAKKEGHIVSELQLQKKNGSKLWASLTITKLNNNNHSKSGTFSIIIRDRTKDKSANDLLHEQEIQLRSLAKHLQEAREEEKLRISRELHDEFSQMLTVLRMDLTVLSRMISKNVEDPLKRVALLEKISSISDLLEKTIRSTRRIITELRPAVLDELGLYTAIQWQAQEFENRTGIRCKIIKLQYDINIDSHTSTVIFRILQEGLTNVAKHSGATNVIVSLKIIKDNLLLEIKDNGRGINKNKLRAPTSTGLLGIRERVIALDGSFEIQSNEGEGTRLLVYVPYKQGENL